MSNPFTKKGRASWRLYSRISEDKPLSEIRKAIEDGADVNEKHSTDGYNSFTLVEIAIYRDRGDVVSLLADKGADIKTENSYSGSTPLAVAAQRNAIGSIKALLDAGADPNHRETHGDTALVRAVRHGAYETVMMLIDRGADINMGDSAGNTALHHAAQMGNANLVNMLMDRGANPRAGNGHLNTPADLATAKDFPRIAEAIRQHGGEGPAAAPVPPKPAPEWVLTSPDEVARVVDKPAIGYRITEIFNFSARLYTNISRNLNNGAESQSVVGFSALDDGRAVDAAHDALVSLGGKHSDWSREKKKLPPPPTPQGGA